jgi:hypothetical protein
MLNFSNFKKYLPFCLIVVISLICRIILSTYGLPYTVHVDESLILKDPLKILLTYKNLDFHIPTNLYNYVLTFWHLIVFCGGFIAGKWHSLLDYENTVARDSAEILFCFRLLNVLLSIVADIIFIRFIIKKINVSYTLKILLSLVIIFNPIVYNSIGFVKFDAICYLFYSILIYLGYNYLVENRVEYRRRLYIICFLAVATRIEEVSFLIGFLAYDFYVIHKHNFKAFFNKKLLHDLLPGFILYILITLIPVALLYNAFYPPKVIYTQTQTFEQVIYAFLSLSAIVNYKYYIINSLVILSPVVMLFFLIKIFRHNKTIKFLIIPLLITNVVLALDMKKNVFYFLLSSVIILFIFMKYIEESKNKKLSLIILPFTLLYFISYDLELLYYIVEHDSNDIAKQVVLTNSTSKDTIIYDGLCDLRIPQSPKILREQITALKEVGGSTGYGLAENLKESTSDSSLSRAYLKRDSDYFWSGKYSNKWLLGYDTSVIKKIKPKLIVVFSHENQFYNSYGTILKNNYTLISQNTYHFIDPRLYYRNFYFFHSFFIFKRNT